MGRNKYNSSSYLSKRHKTQRFSRAIGYSRFAHRSDLRVGSSTANLILLIVFGLIGLIGLYRVLF